MIIYFYLLIALKILTVETSSIRDRTLKNDLVSLLSSRAELGRKDSNSLKIISQEPFIIQLGVSNGSENVNTKDDIKERKRKRPAKKRFSKLKSLRKKHRIRRDLKTSEYKRISNDDMRKSNQTERLMTDEAAKNLLANITSKQLAQGNTIKRQEMFQALTQVINETQQELDRRYSTDEDLDKQIYEWLKAQDDRKQSSHHQQSLPLVGMMHQLSRKTDKNQPKYTYKDLTTDRDRLEQKIKYLKNYMSSNDSKMADDGTRVRRKSESEKVNKMAKMFLTLSAVNGMNDRKKFRCKEEEDDYDGNFWSDEGKSSPMRRTTSTNEERYKVKKWIEHLKSKRSSRGSCPCQNNGQDDDTDVFPLELKVSKGLSSRDLGESEESGEAYRGYSRFLDYPYGKSSRTNFYKPRYPVNSEDLDNKLSALSKRGRRKYDLPLDDLETYRSRAKMILQNAEEILDRIKEEEEKRRTTPGCLANHLKEITSRIQGDPRNSENDLIRVIQKTLGWNPLTNADAGTNEGGKDTEGGSFPHNKWSTLDPYEKAKALTEENTRQLSSYLLRNLGKLGGQTTEQPEQVEESKPGEPEADEKTQIYQGQVPQDKDSVLSSDDLRRENDPDSDSHQLGQGIGDVPTMIPGSQEDLLKVKNLQEPIKDKIKEILEEQGKKIQELAGKESSGEAKPDDLRHSIVTLEDYLDRIEENRVENPVPWKQSVESPEENDENDENPTNLEQVEAVKGNEDENPTDSNQEDKVEAVESKANTENDDELTDPDQEEEGTSKLLQAPKQNFMDAESENPKSGETEQDQVLQEKEALEGNDNRPELDDDDQVEAVEGKQSDDQDDDTLSDVNQNDKVEAIPDKEKLEDEKTTELTEDDKVEAVEGRSNDEGDEDPKDVNQDDKVEAINSKEKNAEEEEEVESVQGKNNEEEDEDTEELNGEDKVEAVQGKSNEETDDPKEVNPDEKVEAMNSKESDPNTEDDEVEAVRGKSNEEEENPEDLNEEDKVEAVQGKTNEEENEDTKEVQPDDTVEATNSKEIDRKTEDDEVEAVEGKNNEEDEDLEDVNEEDKVEAVQGKSNEEVEDPEDLNRDEKVEAINSKEKVEVEDEDLKDLNQEDKVEAVQGKSNEEENDDPQEVNSDDKVEAANSKESGREAEDDKVEAVREKGNEENEDPESLNQDDKADAVEGEQTTEGNGKLTDPKQKIKALKRLKPLKPLKPLRPLRPLKPLKSLKKNFKNVDSDDKTKDSKSGENTQDPVVKQENEKQRSSEGEDPNEEVDFTNKETPKESSVEDENEVIASQHLSNSGEQESEVEPEVGRMSNPEDGETSKLTNEDLTVAEADPSNFEESSESELKSKQNDENDETNQDNVAAENPKSDKELDEDDPEEQIQEKEFAAAKHSTTSQENKSEESNDPITGKTSNSDEETSDGNDRDENDLIASKHLKKADEPDGVPSMETGEELNDDDNTDDTLAKEHVSKTDEMIQRDSTETGSSSKETEDDATQVGSEKDEKLSSTESDKSKSLESQGDGDVPDEMDSKIVGVPENDNQILEAQKTDGEDNLQAEGLARVIENILGVEESKPDEDGEDSKDGMIQAAPTTDESPTAEDVVKELPIQPDSSTSGEVVPLLTFGKKQNADPESSDELLESSQHDPEVTARENVNDEDWSVELKAPHNQESEPFEENISEEPHVAKSVDDEDWSPETETAHHQTSKSREPDAESRVGEPAFHVGENGSEENLDYDNNNDDDTLRAANPDEDDQDIEPDDDLKHEDNLRATHSYPRNIKLSVPRSVGDIIKDLNDGKIKYGDDMSSLDPEKIDYFIDKIDQAELANDKGPEVDCIKECACADEIDTRSRKIGRYEIVKDILHWMKDLQMNRVLSDS